MSRHPKGREEDSRAQPRRAEPWGPASSSRREAWAAGVFLTALVAAAFSNVLLGGKSLVLTDNHNPMDSRFLAANYGENFFPESAWSSRWLDDLPNVHDPGAAWWQWEPSGEFFRKAIRAGELPFWDPYAGAGAPSMGNLTAAYFFPPYLAMVLLGNTALLKNVYFLLLLLSAGFFTHAFLRRHGLSSPAALFGAAAFMFSGDLIVNASSFIGQTAECLPFVLFVTRWFLDWPTWRRAGILSAGYAAVSLASFPPLLLAIFGFAAFYAFVMVAWREEEGDGPGRAGVLARYAVASGLAVGLVAFYYVPAFRVAGHAPYVVDYYRDQGFSSLPLATLFQLLGPELGGGEIVYSPRPMPDPYYLHLHYVGLLPILLALLADRRANRRGPLFGALLGGGLLVLLKMVGAAPLQWIAFLPGLNSIHFAIYFGLLVSFAICGLAAMGLENLLQGRVSRVRSSLVLAAAAVALCSLWQLSIVHGVAGRPNPGGWIRQFKFASLFGLSAVLAIAWVSLRRTSARERRALSFALLAVVGVQAVAYTRYPRQYRWDVWRHPVPYVRRLMAEAGSLRVLNYAGFPGNVQSAFGILGVDSMYTFNPTRTYEIYRRYLAADSWLFLREATLFPSELLLDRASVGIVAIRTDRPALLEEATRRGYARRFDDGETVLLRRDSLPRYFFTSEYRVVEDEQALELVDKGGRSRELLLEEHPAAAAAPNAPGDPAVEIVSLRRNRVTLRVRAPRSGLVYASEAHFPGWTARVNGKPVPILPANYAFRAVEVAAGPSTIELRYDPPGLVAGGAISLAAAGLLAFLCLRRAERPAPERPA